MRRMVASGGRGLKPPSARSMVKLSPSSDAAKSTVLVGLVAMRFTVADKRGDLVRLGWTPAPVRGSGCRRSATG